MTRNHILLCCVLSLLLGCHTNEAHESVRQHDELVAKGLVAIKTVRMSGMAFAHKPLSDILSDVYKQCNLRLTEETGYGLGLTTRGVTLDKCYTFEIPELSIYEVYTYIAQRVGASVRYEDGRIYIEKQEYEQR